MLRSDYCRNVRHRVINHLRGCGDESRDIAAPICSPCGNSAVLSEYHTPTVRPAQRPLWLSRYVRIEVRSATQCA